MRPIRVIIIDDNKRIRFIVRETLKAEEDIEVCAEAENTGHARAAILEHRPDIAILDISLEETDGGLKLLQEMSASEVPTRFIMLSAHNEVTHAGKCLRAGAQGYVCKDKTVQCLADAIRAVHSGKSYVSAEQFV